MKQVVSAAHLDAAMANRAGECDSCILAQAFNVTVGFDPDMDGTYLGFTEHSQIREFCEMGQMIAGLYDIGRANKDDSMMELRRMLPTTVSLE
jgi:hypothetical protein